MKGFSFLLGAQFLSAFVDNMILFIAQAIILRDAYPNWYLQLVQATFLLAYILLSPWAGRIADRYPKRNVLALGNLAKCIGVASLLAGLDPALSYAVTGVGAVIYSPAKYGILPCLAAASDTLLLKANARVEGLTILAILAGAPVGGWLADHSTVGALAVCMALYLVSSSLCLGIPCDRGDTAVALRGAMSAFARDCKAVLANQEGVFSLCATSGFWTASAVLRLAVFLWLPVTFGIHDQARIGLMVMLSGAGLVFAAVLVPILMKPGQTSRVIGVGTLMGLTLVLQPWISWLPGAVALQTLCGTFGGMYLIPMNAMLQRVGERGIGTGKIVAIQNFAENSCMFCGVMGFLAASRSGVPVEWVMGVNGVVLLCVVALLARMNRYIHDKN